MATPELKTIRRYGNIMEAELALMLLKGAGINAILADELLAASVGTAFVPTGMRLQVPEEQVARAEEILETTPTEVEMPAEFAAQQTDEPPGQPHAAPEAAPPSVLTCTGCSATWELTEAEQRERGEFKCPDCGTMISKLEPEPANVVNLTRRQEVKDLIKSREAWKYIAIMVALNLAFERLWAGTVGTFLPPYHDESSYIAFNWTDTLYHLFRALIYSPVRETLVLGGAISLAAFLGAPFLIQVAVGAVGPCIMDGRVDWQHGVMVIPSFILMSWVYIHWRPKSWMQALVVVLVIHTGYNALLDTGLFTDQIKRDITSLHTKGRLFELDNAYAEYEEGQRLYFAGHYDRATPMLKDAAARDNTNPYAFTYLAWSEMRQGDYADAKQVISTAMQTSPGIWQVWMAQGFELLHEKQYGEALEAGERAVALTQDYDRAEAMNELAELRAGVQVAPPQLRPAVTSGS